MPTDPLPAPTSHSTPVRGSDSAPSTIERTSPLVIMPLRWANWSSERPQEIDGPPAAPSGAMTSTTDRGSNWPAASPSRSVSTTCSSCSPSRLATTTLPGPRAPGQQLLAQGLRGVGRRRHHGHLRRPQDVGDGVAEGPAVGRDDLGVVPAHAGGGPGEGDRRRGREDPHRVAVQLVDQDPRQAEEARVTRRQDADAPSFGVPATDDVDDVGERTDQLDAAPRLTLAGLAWPDGWAGPPRPDGWAGRTRPGDGASRPGRRHR